MTKLHENHLFEYIHTKKPSTFFAFGLASEKKKESHKYY